MAEKKRDRAPSTGTSDLSDEEVDDRWHDIVTTLQPEEGGATRVWNSLGDDYKSLGERRCT